MILHGMKRSVYIIALALASCAPARFVEPLDKGEWSVGADLGGPMLNFNGAPIPVPLSQIEVGYGLDSNLTIHGGLHTTSLLFGNGQLDAGVTWKVYNQNRAIPSISVSGGINVIYSPSTRKGDLWPVLDANAYWNYGKRNNYIYLGINNYFDFSSRMANDQTQRYHWIASPQIGHVVKGKRDRWQLITEFKYLAPYLASDKAFVPYTGLFHHGALGFYIGVRRTF